MKKRLVAFLVATAMCFGVAGTSIASAAGNTSDIKNCHGQVIAIMASANLQPNDVVELVESFFSVDLNGPGDLHKFLKQGCNDNPESALFLAALAACIFGDACPL